MWYCNIVIFWQKNYDPISQYHTECDIVIFYQNGSSRMSQYHMDVILWYSIKIVRAILKYSE